MVNYPPSQALNLDVMWEVLIPQVSYMTLKPWDMNKNMQPLKWMKGIIHRKNLSYIAEIKEKGYKK